MNIKKSIAVFMSVTAMAGILIPTAANVSAEVNSYDSTNNVKSVENIQQNITAASDLNGWKNENGHYVYYKNNVKYTGWHNMGAAEGENIRHWSYFGEDGHLRTGWVQLGKGTANPDGNVSGHWSYFGDNGWLRTGWVQFGKGTANPDGNVAKHFSYFGDNGWLRTGWVQFGQGTANPDGNAAKHFSYFGDNGWLRTGWVQFGQGTANPDGNVAKHFSYFGDNGWLRTGWVQFGQGTANPDGNVAGHWSYFGDNGWMRTGLQSIGQGTANPDGNTSKHLSFFGDNGWLRVNTKVYANNTEYTADGRGWLSENKNTVSNTVRNTGNNEVAVSYYILNTNSKIFHKPTCSAVSRMSEKNKRVFDGTRIQAINNGYSPCHICNP